MTITAEVVEMSPHWFIACKNDPEGATYYIDDGYRQFYCVAKVIDCCVFTTKERAEEVKSEYLHIANTLNLQF